MTLVREWSCQEGERALCAHLGDRICAPDIAYLAAPTSNPYVLGQVFAIAEARGSAASVIVASRGDKHLMLIGRRPMTG